MIHPTPIKKKTFYKFDILHNQMKMCNRKNIAAAAADTNWKLFISEIFGMAVPEKGFWLCVFFYFSAL